MPKITTTEKLERSFYWWGIKQGMDLMPWDIIDRAQSMNLTAFTNEEIAQAITEAYFGLGFGGDINEYWDEEYQEILEALN